jgi:integrase
LPFTNTASDAGRQNLDLREPADSKRDVPIPHALADRLRALDPAPDDFVFCTATGTVLDPDNPAMRVLAPACQAAGVERAGFHTFRHTVASRLFAEGRNVVQVQRRLGHHSASFTLDTYVHLLDNDLGEPLQGSGQTVLAEVYSSSDTYGSD